MAAKTRTYVETILFLAGLACLWSCSGASEGPITSFAGSYGDDSVRLELSQTGDEVRGTLKFLGDSYKIEAEAGPQGLAGTFASNPGQQFSFTARWVQQELEFTTDGNTYLLPKKKVTNPFTAAQANAASAPRGQTVASASPAPTQSPSPAPPTASPGATGDPKLSPADEREAAALAEAPQLTQNYRHPAGVYFLYPEGWRVTVAGDAALALEPPNPRTVSGATVERYLILGEETAGTQRPDDPQVVQLADSLVSQALPYLKRTGDVATHDLGGRQYARIDWAGECAQPKVSMRTTMWVGILGEYAIAVLAIIDEPYFEARERLLRDVVASIGYEAPKREYDPRLIGAWSGSDTYLSGEFSSTTYRWLNLRADGTCSRNSKLHYGMTHHDSGGHQTGWSSGDSGEAPDSQGRWHTKNKVITLVWENGTQEWNYFVSDGSMLFKTEGGSKQLWSRAD